MRSKIQHTIQSELTRASKQLQPKKIMCQADRELGDLEAEILLAHILKKDRSWIRAHDEKTLTSSQKDTFNKFVKRRKKHEPIAYIIGYKDFYGLRLNINPSVLVPRPASETVVDLVVGIEMQKAPIILDIGTGSGAIAIAIAKHLPKAKVIGTDISDNALRVARSNSKKLNIKNIHFQKSDLLSSTIIRFLKKTRRPLIITTNLPYLPVSDKKKLAQDIIKYEPPSALFSGNDGNDLIVHFLSQLQDSGIRFNTVLLEFDAPQARTLQSIAKKLFPLASIQIHKDFDGKNRVLRIRM